jgi:hypothetical protein
METTRARITAEHPGPATPRHRNRVPAARPLATTLARLAVQGRAAREQQRGFRDHAGHIRHGDSFPFPSAFFFSRKMSRKEGCEHGDRDPAGHSAIRQPGKAAGKSRSGPLPAWTRCIHVPQPHHHSTQTAQPGIPTIASLHGLGGCVMSRCVALGADRDAGIGPPAGPDGPGASTRPDSETDTHGEQPRQAKQERQLVGADGIMDADDGQDQPAAPRTRPQ